MLVYQLDYRRWPVTEQRVADLRGLSLRARVKHLGYY